MSILIKFRVFFNPYPHNFMPKSTQTGRLLLTPRDAHATPEAGPIVNLLTDMGLIGAPLPSRPRAYRVGERFLQLISFAGCSPHIQLAPPPDGSGAFCHIQVLGPEPAIRLLTGRNTRRSGAGARVAAAIAARQW